MRMTLLVHKIYAMRICESETLLRQHVSNIERLYEKNIVRQHCNDIETIAWQSATQYDGNVLVIFNVGRLTAEFEQNLLFCMYLNCDIIAIKKIFKNNVSVPLYFYFKSNFKYNSKKINNIKFY